MEKIPAPGRCCSSGWWFATSAWSSDVSVNFCWTVSHCLHMTFRISIPFLSLIRHRFLFLTKCQCFQILTSHFSPIQPVNTRIILLVLVPFLLSCSESEISVSVFWYLFQWSVSGWHMTPPPQMSGFKTIYCFLSWVCGLIGLSWTFLTGLSCVIEVRCWLEPQSSEVLMSRLPKMAHLGDWPLMCAVGWEFNWSVTKAPTHGPSNSPMLGSERQHAKSKYSKWWTLKLLKQHEV